MATISSPGVGSNLDVNSIVTQLMTVEKQPLTLLNQREASYQAKLSAFGSLSGALSSFQSSLSNLTLSSKFNAFSATMADTSIASATARSSAQPGSYNINVTQLAKSQTLITQGVASTSAAIGGSGKTTLSFDFGTIGADATLSNGVYSNGSFAADATRATATVTIDSSNNTLQGIRDAINAANLGVSASIISDGSATPYRLVLTSTASGANSSMRIQVDGDAGLQNLLSYDAAGTQNLTQTSQAQDSKLTVNGINVVSHNLSVADAIQGTTLTLSKEGSTTLTVSRDTSSLSTTLNGFVTAYNNLQKTISSLTSYDPDTKAAGTLNGDATTRMVQNQVRQVLGNTIGNTGGQLNSLTQLGISIDKSGTMSLDSSKLQKAIDNNYADIGSLFATVGRPSDSLITYSSSSAATKVGSYDVKVTQLATQGALTGSRDLSAGSTTIAAGTSFKVTLDGQLADVALPAGTYSASELAAALQSAINNTGSFKTNGSTVAVSLEGGHLKILSGRYGSASNVSIASGSGSTADSLLGTTTASIGVDSAGSIGGVPAMGSGRYLIGATGSDAEGLKLEIGGGALGARGTVSFSTGYAAQLDKLITGIIGSKGSIATATDGINSSIKDIGKQVDQLNAQLLVKQQRYLAQFNALDVAISNMNSTSSFLTQQLNLIANQSKA